MSLEGSISIHRASCCFLIWKLPVCVTPKLILFLLVTRQQHAAKAYSRYIMTNKLNATFVATLLQCAAATTSALLQGLWPTNPFTPRKHKPINTFCREPDNPPFQLASRLSFITGILSLLSFLVTRQTNTAHDPWLSSKTCQTGPWPLTGDSKVIQVEARLDGHNTLKGLMVKWHTQHGATGRGKMIICYKDKNTCAL